MSGLTILLQQFPLITLAMMSQAGPMGISTYLPVVRATVPSVKAAVHFVTGNPKSKRQRLLINAPAFALDKNLKHQRMTLVPWLQDLFHCQLFWICMRQCRLMAAPEEMSWETCLLLSWTGMQQPLSRVPRVMSLLKLTYMWEKHAYQLEAQIGSTLKGSHISKSNWWRRRT